MKKIVNITYIEEVANYVKDQIGELVAYQKELLNTIDMINNYYVGEDATKIIEKYKMRVNSLDNIINEYENVDAYFYTIVDYYRNTKCDFVDRIKKIKIDISESSLVTPNINLNVLESGNENDISLLDIGSLELELLNDLEEV